jgi:hypothetical protein
MFIAFIRKINVISVFLSLYYFFMFKLVTNYCMFFVHKVMVIKISTLGATMNWVWTCYVCSGFEGWATTSMRIHIICYW